MGGGKGKRGDRLAKKSRFGLAEGMGESGGDDDLFFILSAAKNREKKGWRRREWGRDRTPKMLPIMLGGWRWVFLGKPDWTFGKQMQERMRNWGPMDFAKWQFSHREL